MQERHFGELVGARWSEGKFLCVGLDPQYEKIPAAARRTGVRETIVSFNRAIIEATKDIACAYKPNSAFYEAYGDEGFAALRETIAFINDQAPEVPVILDGKRGDIGITNDGYVASAYERLRADAVTVHPYLGREALAPFLSRADKGVFVLCRTSNSGAGELQDLKIGNEPLYEIVAQHVAHAWNEKGNCGLVAGATYPEELENVRAAAPNVPILIPGVGAQGGDVARAVAAGKDARGAGILIAASRSILYASDGDDFAAAAASAAAALHGEIRKSL